MKVYDTAPSEYSGASCEDSAPSFDTKAAFEQWLRLLEAIHVRPEINLSTEPEPADADAMT